MISFMLCNFTMLQDCCIKGDQSARFNIGLKIIKKLSISCDMSYIVRNEIDAKQAGTMTTETFVQYYTAINCKIQNISFKLKPDVSIFAQLFSIKQQLFQFIATISYTTNEKE